MSRLPAVFLGHGSPMHAIQRDEFTDAWRELGAELPRPKAILAISAHWYVPGTYVTASERPRTIHDFGGFPRPLYEVRYPAPGDPALAARIRELLAPVAVGLDTSWGLDHGTWSVLVHAFPDASIPVVQLAIDETQPPAFHYHVGRMLAPLRDEGVLVLGSGNVVHNLHAYAWGRHQPEPFDWLVRFENAVRERLVAHDHQPLVDYEGFGRDATLSVPTPEHYLPLLYVAGTQRDDESVRFPVSGVDGGSVSMLSVVVG